MEELRISTGVVEYSLNGAVSVSFNPTDVDFMERLYKQFDDLDDLQEEYLHKVEASKNPLETFEATREIDKIMRDRLNGTFGEDICTPLFGHMSVNALSEGMPLWANVLFAIIDKMDTAADKEHKLSSARIEKYTKKYSGSKYHK